MSFLSGLVRGYLGTRRRRRAGNWADRAAFEQWQQQRLLTHLQWVAKRSAFYRANLGASPTLATWQAMRPIEKAEWLANFDGLVTVPVTRDDAYRVAQAAYASRDFSQTLNGYTVGLSSGTTGAPGLFVASARERGEWAGTALAAALPRHLRWPVRVALALRANSRLYESLNLGAVQFTWLDLHRAPAEHVAALHRARPNVLVGPPSVLADLVEAGLRLAPRRVLCVAETLTDDVAQRLAHAFGGPVMQLYQATEGFLGAPCAHGTLHLNEDVAVIEREIVDEATGRFVPVLTDFRRRSQPIIRYRLTDVLVPRRTACACGSPLAAIERVEGRCDDVWRLPAGGGGLVSVYPDQVSLAIGSAVGEAMHDFTAVRHADGRIEVLMEWAYGVDGHVFLPQVEHALKALLQARGARPAEVQVTSGRRMRDDRKHRRVMNAAAPIPQ